MSEQLIRLAEVLLPLIVYAIFAAFKTNQTQREEVAHALDTALTKLRAGEIKPEKAAELVLATGAVSASKVEKIIGEMQVRLDESSMLAIYKDNVVPGVAVSINTKGDFKVDPTGLLNNKAHKLNKWLKKKVGVKIF